MLCCWERLAWVTDEMCDRVETLGVAVLGLSVGEPGCASEPAPIGGVGVCAELLGKGWNSLLFLTLRDCLRTGYAFDEDHSGGRNRKHSAECGLSS